MNLEEIDPLIITALKEDMPLGDVTSESVIPPDSYSEAVLLAKEDGVLAGMPVAERVFEKIDPAVLFKEVAKDGKNILAGEKLARLRGNSISLLKGERTALNFLQRMSGIATTTRKFVRLLEGSHTKLLDTRKTTPGLRVLEKYAVKIGGAMNHRFSLSDMVLIKDNHIEIVGSITKAVQRAKNSVKSGIKIEVETNSLVQVKEAFGGGVDMIMLDNMSLEDMKKVVDWVDHRVPLEASGNIDLTCLEKIAAVGVDFISVGGLTHSYKSLDISMKFL